MSHLAADGSWILADCQQFVTNFFLEQRTDEPVNDMLRRVNAQIWGKLSRYTGYKQGLHLFSNAISDPHGVASIELDYMFFGSTARNYATDALKSRNVPTQPIPDISLAPCLRSICERDRLRATGLLGKVKQLCGPLRAGRIEKHLVGDWLPVLNLILDDLTHSANDTVAISELTQTLSKPAAKLLLVPFSAPTERLPTGHCGLFIMWDGGPNREDSANDHEGRMRFAAKLLSASLTRFVRVHYEANEDTYLPKYRQRGQKRVAILFADIRNFTPTTEILRNFGRIDTLMEFMQWFCNELGEAVWRNKGRVLSYTGDGMMAAFGEYMSDDTSAVKAAITTSIEMYAGFQKLKSRFFEQPTIVEFVKYEYETLEFDLGIGVSFGPVIFDYFGPIGHRIYTPLGDHVNFAQRLEASAGRFDTQLARLRSPILCSRPAWMALNSPEHWTRLELDIKGKANNCMAFEVPISG